MRKQPLCGSEFYFSLLDLLTIISLCLTGDDELLITGDGEKLRQRARPHHGPLSQSTRGTGCYSHCGSPSLWCHLTNDRFKSSVITQILCTHNVP